MFVRLRHLKQLTGHRNQVKCKLWRKRWQLLILVEELHSQFDLSFGSILLFICFGGMHTLERHYYVTQQCCCCCCIDQMCLLVTVDYPGAQLYVLAAGFKASGSGPHAPSDQWTWCPLSSIFHFKSLICTWRPSHHPSEGRHRTGCFSPAWKHKVFSHLDGCGRDWCETNQIWRDFTDCNVHMLWSVC